MEKLLAEIRACTFCENQLPLGPNPVVFANQKAAIAIIGQAPGTKVHQSGIPWDDQSGKLLREWMELAPEQFYNNEKIAIVPMGFCYPGKGKSGDLPPRSECAELWHKKLMDQMPKLKLVLLIGQYSQKYYLGKNMKTTLTETVANFEDYGALYFPLPHPSPRNRIWLKRNLWFDEINIPELRKRLKTIL